MKRANIEDLWVRLRRRLAAPGYPGSCASESAFEDAVWARVVRLAKDIDLDVGQACLTSHVERVGRSAESFRRFRDEAKGPDVTVLGSRNRLDIVVKADCGSIGIEVKLLGSSRHTAKLTQGLGQAVLALAHRDRTILIIHCGSVDPEERESLRKTWRTISEASGMALIVVP